MDVHEFWDSCAQNKTSEISTIALSGILGLLCADGAEAEPAAEEDAEAEAEAGGVHGGNNCRQFPDRGSEAGAG